MRGRKVTNKVFKDIKDMLDNNVPEKYVQKAMGISYHTVLRAKQSDTYKDYKDKVKPKLADTKPAPITSPYSSDVVQENLGKLADKIEAMTKAVQENTIATYSLRKAVKEDDSGSNVKTKWFRR